MSLVSGCSNLMSSVIICGVEIFRLPIAAPSPTCMNKDNWAKLTGHRPGRRVALLAQGTAQGSAPATASANGGPVKPATAGRAAGRSQPPPVPRRHVASRAPSAVRRFVVPVPGRPGIKGSAHTLAGRPSASRAPFRS